MKQLIEYLRTAPLNVSELERQAGLPARSVHRALYGKNARNIRPKKWWAVLTALAPAHIAGYYVTAAID